MEFRTKSHGVGLKSHGLVWNLTGWFEISRVGLKSHRVCLKSHGVRLKSHRVRLKSHGVLLNHMRSSEISQVFIFKKKLELPGPQTAFTSPHSIWMSNLPLGLERPSLIWISISIVALSLVHFCWNLPLLSPNTTHTDRGSRPKGKFDIQIEQGPSTLKAALIFTVYKSENY